ncbi:restriction endonuclease subunit S [Pseudarthrobacter sp. MDT3-28]|uniref:restriction endonuclease subunit S n=1 Tax=Pseudarthrobacter raffinosi TaxID=2953651 RepID=UPI00208F8516|nr:restriction endonuclease subunit S [Pseudarthrobacter sp. MDT3-28]MCO4237157.1 restriction endonuclease subunit S [Pseudarthrobacter sp. MDT3-28]
MSELTVRDLGSLFDGPHATPTRIDAGPYFLNIASLVEGRLDLDKSDHVSEADFGKWTKRVEPAEGDLLFSYETRLGEAALMPAGVRACLGRRMALIRPNRSIVDPKFLLYLYLSPVFQRTIEQHTIHGATVNRISLSTMGAWPVTIPKLDEQQSIADVLGALDDKVAANTKLTRTAEELLQASYRGLIDAVPLKRVPVESLIDRITPKRKFANDELLKQGDFPVFDQSEAGLLGYLNGEGFLDASAEHPMLYFGDHTCKLRLAAERFTVGPNTVPFTGSGIPSLTLYCALNGLQNHEEYKRHWQLLVKKEVEIPSSQWATDFASRHRHLLNTIKSVSRENTLLAATRDALLPQLMSGKLRVKDAEAVLEKAGV